MSKITFQDKENLQSNPSVLRINKVIDEDINEIKEVVNNNDTNTNNNFSDAYDSSLTYNVGDYCIYDDKLRKCKTEITTAESFDSNKWENVNITSEISKTKTTTFNGQWLVAQTAGGGGTRIMIPISNPNNNEPILDIESAEMYSTSQGWKKVSSVSLAGFSETFCMLQLTAPFSITAGYNYLVRLSGTIKTN